MIAVRLTSINVLKIGWHHIGYPFVREAVDHPPRQSSPATPDPDRGWAFCLPLVVTGAITILHTVNIGEC